MNKLFHCNLEGTNVLSVDDKAVLRNDKAAVISELERLEELMKSNDYVRLGHRLSLLNCKRLAVILGIKDPTADELEGVSKALKLPAKTHLTRNSRDLLLRCVKFLKTLIVAEEKTSDTETLMQEFNEKLKLDSFDDMFEETGTIRKDLWDKLCAAGVWQFSPDFNAKTVHIKGDLTPGEFVQNTQGFVDHQFFHYEQQEAPAREKRDDSCVHAGCELSQSDLDYRHFLSPLVKSALKKFSKESDGISVGATGLFLRKGSKHFLVTAAHVLFPELSSMPLQSSELKLFNENVGFAVYDEKYDIAMYPYPADRPHSNGIRVAKSESWVYKPSFRCSVVKVGPKSGLTLGKLESLEDAEKEYRGLVRIKPNTQASGQAGDSGSIYTAESDHGFLPIGVHRMSSKGDGLGSSFIRGFEFLLEKGQFGELKEFQACTSGAGKSCEATHLVQY